MEQHRFDDLTRAAAHRGSRRGFLRGLIGAVVASLGLGAFGRDAGAQDCPAGTSMCGGTCIDVMSDKWNCGSCGNICSIIDGVTLEQNACVEGQCTTVCGADLCGEDCVDLNMSVRHCGACGNSCASGEMCCGGRCFNPDHYERYCDWCGYQGGFPQGCNPDEVCDGGLCIPAVAQGATETAAATTTYYIGSWTCAAAPDTSGMIEPPFSVAGPGEPTAWDFPGCVKDEGLVYVLYDAAGNQVGSCETQAALCIAEVPEGVVTSVVAQNLPAGVTPQVSGSDVTHGMAVIFNVAEAATQEATVPTTSATGQLAYAIRDGQHWSIWIHDLLGGENTPLADEPGSDQFAPAWSHDGTRIAYLSDQASGVNQVWLMDAGGANQRQLSDYAGGGNLIHIAWSWDDAAIVVTEAGADGSDRMLSLPPGGGSLTSYIDHLGGWPSFGEGDRMAFVGEGDLGMPGILMRVGSDLRWDVVPDSILNGEYMVGEPCLTTRGTDLALSIGQPGARRVVAFGPYTDRPIPDIPRVGSDNSNPVWSPDETQLAFVAVDASGQSIVIQALSEPGSAPTAIDIPPHDRVWYLSWNQAAGSTPPPVAESPSIESPTEAPLVPGLTTFTSPGYGWRFSYESIIYTAESPDPETIAISPIGGSRNDWSLTLMTLDASRPSYPVKLNTITEFSVATCIADHDARHGWTISPDSEAPRPHLQNDMVYQQVFLGMRGVWGFAACYEMIPGEAVVVVEGIAYNFDDDNALFDRLDRMLAEFKLPG